MNYQFNGTRGKWYPVNFGVFWSIHDEDFYDSIDIFDEEECSEAKQNAILASKAPEMFDMLKKVLYLSPLLRYSGKIKSEHVGEAMAVEGLLDGIEQLLKETTQL